MAGIGISYDIAGLCIAGVVASRTQWRFGIFPVGLQMTIKLYQVKLFGGCVECMGDNITMSL